MSVVLVKPSSRICSPEYAVIERPTSWTLCSRRVAVTVISSSASSSSSCGRAGAADASASTINASVFMRFSPVADPFGECGPKILCFILRSPVNGFASVSALVDNTLGFADGTFDAADGQHGHIDRHADVRLDVAGQLLCERVSSGVTAVLPAGTFHV